MRSVPRERFVQPSATPDQETIRRAYEDRPLPIGKGQTISQPYVVAYMTQELQIRPGDRVLEVGTGSGYQAAVLAQLAGWVYTIEIIPELSARARGVLADLGYENITTMVGDGGHGWPEHAPFQAIMVTAAAQRIPDGLVEQLEVGGRLIAPVGPAYEVQDLVLVERHTTGTDRRMLIPVRFVPLTGEAGW
jgi:protein-L-isoaspartate(D-aspartate) O-methyltransferase